MEGRLTGQASRITFTVQIIIYNPELISYIVYNSKHESIHEMQVFNTQDFTFLIVWYKL